MPKVKWTKEQEKAIYEKGSNILVAAAAGSGKTAVLVERIINKIVNENIDIDRILVVTFTNAAASEMRERILDAIYKKIEESPDDVCMQKQITLLNKASICTIHSFCLDVIRNYFYELDISANFRIGDTTEVELLKQDILEDLFEDKYINKDKEFLNLINTYTTYRGDEPLKELILKIYDYIQSAPFPQEWLEEKVEMFNLKEKLNEDFGKTVWGKILLKEYEEKIKESILKLERVKRKLLKYPELEKYTLTIINDIETLNEIENQISYDNKNIWDKTYQKVSNLKFEKWPINRKISIALKEEAKEIRDKVKKDIDTINKKVFIYDSYRANQDMYAMYETLSNLKNIVNEFEKRFLEKKKEKNIIDFHDIEHFALKILIQKNEQGEYVATEVANKIKEKFTEIAIDEYQDSNLVQEYILSSISNGNNIFMVGDVKQSIYRFRQARPELFLEKYENYMLENSKEAKGTKIQLFKNFRSRKNVLDITNSIFEQIMSKELGDIDYNQEEYLNLGADYPQTNNNLIAELHIIDLASHETEVGSSKLEAANYINDKTEIIDNKIVVANSSHPFFEEAIQENEDANQEEPIENTLIEAKFVANKIQELINSKYKVYDRKKGYRPIEYKDIVILLRSTLNSAPVYEKELIEKNIPVFSDTSSEYLESTEIQTIMSVLKIINNPLQDIPLITVLRSSIASFTDNDLVQIRLADRSESFYNAMLKARMVVEEKLKEKINIFITMLEKWKDIETYKTLDELIWQIYMDSNYYNYVGLLNNGKLRQANLKMLFEKAKQYERASFKGLYNFINFVDKLKISSKDMTAAKIIGENDNVVRIMSIHKSKGLEFPVVFLCGTSKKFNMQDLNNNVLMHQDLGFGMKYINYERGIEYNTLAKEALRLRIRKETISEEMRVLYVALTRAKEKLFITGIEKDLQKSLKEKETFLEIYNSEKLNKNLVEKYISYLDWIELVYLNDKEKMSKILEIANKHLKEIEELPLENSEEYKTIIFDLEKINNCLDFQEIIKKNKELNINKILDWQYKYKQAENIPTKTSVSKIKEENIKQQGIGTFLQEKIEEIPIKNTLEIPKFEKEEKITGVQKGTLIHLCIKNLDEKKDYELKDIIELIKYLENKNIINNKEAESINTKTLLQFTKSSLFKELKEAKEVHKEEPFYINIPASEIYNKEVEENILVQGIIDLYYINKQGNIVLVDYKTDYVQNENELIQKYKPQLELYKKALEGALKKEVKKVIIYSTYLQKEINVS